MESNLLTRRDGTSAEDIKNLGPHLNRVVWALAAISGLFLGLRLYCKLWKKRSLWWDDHFLIASWVSLVISTSLQSAAVSHGLGKHYFDIPPSSINAMNFFSISAGFASILAASWSKTSFAISLLRISGRGARIFVWFVIGSVNIVFAFGGTLQWVQCWPVSRQWTTGMVEGRCLSQRVVQSFFTFAAAYSGMMDIVLALLPWAVLWDVAISKKEKIGALLAMSLGVFAGIMSFLKISTLHVIGDDNGITVDLFTFGTAEPATAIMAASMPILRAMFQLRSSSPKRIIEMTEDGRLTSRSTKKSNDPEVVSL